MDDLHVERMTPLPTPAQLREAYPVPEAVAARVQAQRLEVAEVLSGADPRKRLLAIVGPCSVHDRDGALRYARQLKVLADRVSDVLLVLMRVYVQKPRTTTGWTGMLDDPLMDGTFKAEIGVEACRQLMLEIATLGLPVATEFLGTTIEPQYLSDLVAFGCVGARTVESQCHRHLVSGVSMPCGFKNRSDGDISAAVQACVCASHPRGFIGVNVDGQPCMIQTRGNPSLCVVLRGSYSHGPNWLRVAETSALLRAAGVAGGGAVVVDCAHGNSGKTVEGQRTVARNVLTQYVRNGVVEDRGGLRGIMIESYHKSGRQSVGGGGGADIDPDTSVTDPCLSLAETRILLDEYCHALRAAATTAGPASKQ